MKFTPFWINSMGLVSLGLLLTSLYQTFTIMGWFANEPPPIAPEPYPGPVEPARREHVNKGHKIFHAVVPLTGASVIDEILRRYAKDHPNLNVCPYKTDVQVIAKDKGYAGIMKYDIILGDHWYYRAKRVLGSKYRYFTMIREPFEHHVSIYMANFKDRIVKKQPAPPFWKWLRNIKMNNSSNPQCSSLDIPLPFYATFRAKDFDWITTTDMLDEGLVYLRDQYKFKDVTYQRKKPVSGKLHGDYLSPKLKEIVKKISPCDFSLYETAKKIIKQNGVRRFKSEENFKKEVEKFRETLPPIVCKPQKNGEPDPADPCNRLDMADYEKYITKLFADPPEEGIQMIDAAIIARPTININPNLLPNRKPVAVQLIPNVPDSQQKKNDKNQQGVKGNGADKKPKEINGNDKRDKGGKGGNEKKGKERKE